AAIGALLLNGVGDTIRVSITGEPVREVYAAKRLLRSLELDKNYVNVISCPTCGRCRWSSASLAEKVNRAVENINKPLTIAVMGCVVNGPGEAADADIGIAGAEDYCVIFKKGKVERRVAAADAEAEFLKEIADILND
ncbi:MAG: flavodoxin-dependent (E)-4-hydroxy-3-methylbut-2-enyl-diphosphate synthase, partial [Clostridia bacterium]|nr:flavodoxin-dependent (E)-4-hydroxy-3-methylbut-2-enyl-diphosphate synthase [Clostridia bacterium]